MYKPNLEGTREAGGVLGSNEKRFVFPVSLTHKSRKGRRGFKVKIQLSLRPQKI